MQVFQKNTYTLHKHSTLEALYYHVLLVQEFYKSKLDLKVSSESFDDKPLYIYYEIQSYFALLRLYLLFFKNTVTFRELPNKFFNYLKERNASFDVKLSVYQTEYYDAIEQISKFNTNVISCIYPPPLHTDLQQELTLLRDANGVLNQTIIIRWNNIIETFYQRIDYLHPHDDNISFYFRHEDYHLDNLKNYKYYI